MATGRCLPGSTIPASTANGALAGSFTTTTTYNVDGSVATRTLPAAGQLAAETLTHTYSTAGLPASMTGLDAYLAAVGYRWDGAIAQTTHGTAGRQIRQDHSYDETTGRLLTHTTSIENQSTPGVFDEAYASAYTYDPAGNITAIAGTTGGVADQAECFRYDQLRRLTTAWTETAAVCATPQRSGADPYHRSWTFDKIGNRLSQTNHDPVVGNTTWTYNVGAGHGVWPHQLDSVTATGPLAGTPVRQFGYSNAGQATSRTTDDGTAQTLTWDAEGHLAAVNTGGQTTNYLYDADVNRLIARNPTGTTLYLGDTEVHQPTGGGAINATRYYGAAIRDSAGLTWAITDHNGTGIIQIDAATLASQRRRHLPYGETRGTQPSGWAGSKGYVGGTLDLTGLSHLGAREYDPPIGRFVSVDPIMDLADPQQMHGYAYANNTPITASDPTGLYFFEGVNGNGLRTQASGGGTSSVAKTAAKKLKGTPVGAAKPPGSTATGDKAVGDALEASKNAFLQTYTDDNINCQVNLGSGLCQVLRHAVENNGFDPIKAEIQVLCGDWNLAMTACYNQYGYQWDCGVAECPWLVTHSWELGLILIGGAAAIAARATLVTGAAKTTPQVLKGPIADAVPKNLPQQLALGAAKEGHGTRIMGNLADDPRLVANYGPGEWVKMQYVLRGNDTNVTVHYFRNLTTKMDVEFKFK